MHVNGLAFEELGVDVERVGIGPDVGHGRLGALAHDVAEHAGEHEALFRARHHGHLHEQDIPAHRRPRQSRGHAGTVGPFGHLVEEVGAAEVFGEVLGGDEDRLAPSLGQPTGHLAGHGGDLPVEASHPRLSRVSPGHLADRLGLEGELVLGQTMGGQLLGDQILPRDPDLLLVRVPDQRQDLHPISKRARNILERVGGGDEEHLRQVEGHAQVVVDEGVVLGGIQDLEQGGGWIAPPVRADLVDLVEHEDGIAGFRPPQSLDDPPRKRADIGPPVSADLRFVPHPAQRHAREFPAEGASDALAQARLAHAGGSHEAEDRLPRRAIPRYARRLGGHRGFPRAGLARLALALLPELLDGEVLEDPVLDLLQVEVVLVQHLTGAVNVDGAPVQLAPRQAGQPFEIRVGHAVLWRRGRDTDQTGELALRLPPRFLGQVGLLDLTAKLGDLAAALLLVPELALNRPELLPQIEVLLLLGEPLLGLRGDLPAQLAHRELALEQLEEPAELGGDGVHLEDFLTHGRVERGHGGHEVRHVAGIGQATRGHGELIGQVVRHRDEAGEDVHDGLAQRLHFRPPGHFVGSLLDPRDEIGLRLDPVLEPDSLQTLDHHTNGSVARSRELVDDAHRAHVVEDVGRGRLHLGIALRDEGQEPGAAHDVVHEPHGARLPHHERGRREGQENRLSERKDGKSVRDGEAAWAGVWIIRHQLARGRLWRVTRRRPRS